MDLDRRSVSLDLDNSLSKFDPSSSNTGGQIMIRLLGFRSRFLMLGLFCNTSSYRVHVFDFSFMFPTSNSVNLPSTHELGC